MTRRPRATVVAVACAVLLAAAATLSPAASSATNDLDVVDGLKDAAPGWVGNIPGLGGTASDPAPAGRMEIRGCTITNPLFKEDDPARIAYVDDLVPEEYTLGTNPYFGPSAATIMVAVLHCDDEPMMTLSLVAVQVVADDSGDDAVDDAWDAYNQSTLNFLPSSSWYLLAVDTDNATMARSLRAAGLSPFLVENLHYGADYSRDVEVDELAVPSSPRHGYRMITTTRFPDPFVHNHDWFFWYDGPRGKAGFFLHMDAMEDSSCGYHLSPLAHEATGACGSEVFAEPGSRIANLLALEGPSRDTPYAFHHPNKKRGYISLIPADRSRKS